MLCCAVQDFESFTERKKIQKVMIVSGPEYYHGSLCGGRKKTFPMWTVDGGKYRKPGAEAKAGSQSVRSVSRSLAYRIRHLGEVPQYLPRYLPTCSRLLLTYT